MKSALCVFETVCTNTHIQEIIHACTLPVSHHAVVSVHNTGGSLTVAWCLLLLPISMPFHFLVCTACLVWFLISVASLST